MKLIPFSVKKRSTTRTVMVPDHGDNSWRAFDGKPSHFRFFDDRTEYTRGKYSITFNLDGYAIEGWSYWTCMYCYSEPTEDFPQGRLIYNGSGYGSTTGQHVGKMQWFFEPRFGTYNGPVVVTKYSRIDKVVRIDHHDAYTYTDCDGEKHTQPAWDHKIMRPTRAYTSKRVTEPKPADSEITQICWGRGATPEGMREKVRRDSLTVAQREAEDAFAAQQAEDARVAREARYAELERQWAEEDARKAAKKKATDFVPYARLVHVKGI